LAQEKAIYHPKRGFDCPPSSILARKGTSLLSSRIRTGMQLDYRGTFATASYLPAPASKNSMPELKITASDGQVTVQELHNILNFVTSALLVESAREGVRLTCDLRSLSLPPTHVTSALVDLLAEFGRQHQALLQEKLVVRKVCVPPGSRFRVAKQILDLLFAACPPTKCTYLVTNLDDIMPEEVAVFGPVHEHGECVTTQDSSYAALLKHHWRRRGSVEKPLKLRRRDRLRHGADKAFRSVRNVCARGIGCESLAADDASSASGAVSPSSLVPLDEEIFAIRLPKRPSSGGRRQGWLQWLSAKLSHGAQIICSA